MKRKIFFGGILALVACLFSAAISSASPERIISLAPDLTEQLYILGGYGNIVGNTTYCPVPKGETGREKVGNLLNMNMEKIVGLKPDIVLATNLSNQRDLEKLEKMGIQVAIFPEPKSFDDLCRQFLRIGEILGKREAAAKIVTESVKRVELIRERVKGFPKPKVFVQIGARPLFTSTGDSFMDDFITFAGGVNIAHDLRNGLYSREEVIRHNPDIILIITMGVAGEREKELWEGFKGLNAVKRGQVIIIDADKFCAPSPLSFPDVLEDMIAIIHPGGGE